jgi:hypothetical protein
MRWRRRGRVPGGESARFCARVAGALAWAIAVLAGTAPSALPAAADLSQGPEMEHAVDPHGRFVIDFPRDWAVRWVGDGSLRLEAVNAHDGVIGFGPAGADGRRINVIVDVRTLPAALSSEGAATYAEAALRHLPGYRPLNAGPYTIGGIPAYYRFFSHVEHGVRLYQLQMYVTQGTQFYVLSGATRTDRMQIRHDLRVIVQIVETFRVLSPHLSRITGGPGSE